MKNQKPSNEFQKFNNLNKLSSTNQNEYRIWQSFHTSQCTEVQAEICKYILLFLLRKNDSERKWLFFIYIFFSNTKSFFKDVTKVWNSKLNTIWMKALQNRNWRPVTDPRLLIIPVPFPLSLPFSFSVPFPPSLFSFFPFYFLVHFVINKTNNPNQIPKSVC